VTVIEPIRLQFRVGCPPERAFSIWTGQTSLWWPASHTVSVEPPLTITFEPQRDGRIFERTTDGREFDWGWITAWEPPSRLVYQWHLRADRADATEVEIRFLPSDEGTTVEIEHRGWERLGTRAIERRNANQAGWGGLLPHYRDWVAAESATESAADPR
jgi:uncharacterized protein YndB with AHSA1/START domain